MEWSLRHSRRCGDLPARGSGVLFPASDDGPCMLQEVWGRSLVCIWKICEVSEVVTHCCIGQAYVAIGSNPVQTQEMHLGVGEISLKILGQVSRLYIYISVAFDLGSPQGACGNMPGLSIVAVELALSHHATVSALSGVTLSVHSAAEVHICLDSCQLDKLFAQVIPHWGC